MKDVLRDRGYRWFGGSDFLPKAWWIEVDEDDVAAELRFLEREVYLREVELRLEAKIEATKADLIKWVVGMIGFQTIVLLGAPLALARAVAR